MGRTRCGSTPVTFMVKIRLDAILAPTWLKVHGTKLVDALHPVHGKFDMDANRLYIYMCFGHGNAGQFMLRKLKKGMFSAN